jgi:thioesterase domain-containing protein/acyl carrier protein
MVAQGARHIVLVDVYVPADDPEPIAALRAEGVIITPLQADLTNARAVEEAVSSVKTPLRGVVHLAGLLRDAMLGEMDWERFQLVMAPKVAGAWNLHHATRKAPLDFFVMFSSITSALGNIGQTNYAAANSFLDSLAHHRHSLGLPALSLHWGAFGKVGMAADLKALDEKAKIDPDIGLDLLGRALLDAPAEVIVAPLAMLLAEMGSPLPLHLSGVEHLLRQDGGGAVGGALLRALHAAEPSSRVSILVRELGSRVLNILGSPDGTSIDAEESLSGMGLDSLMVMELRSVVKQEVGVLLGPDALLTNDTLGELSALLVTLIDLGEEGGAGGEGGDVETPAIMVALTPESETTTKAPFFCVQGAGRGDFLYKGLADALEERPFYELRPLGQRYDTIGELAAVFCAEVVAAHPTGPLVLGGWSFGGFVAYEMARQLVAAGRVIESLVLLDWVEPGMVTPSFDVHVSALGALVRSLELGAGRPLGEVDVADVDIDASASLEAKFEAITAVLISRGLLRRDVDTAELLDIVRDFSHAIGTLATSELGPGVQKLGVPIVALSASRFGFPGMQPFVWDMDRRAPPLALRVVDTDHWSLLRDPAIGEVGRFVAESLG